MADLKGKFSEARSEKAVIPHITLIIDVKNNSSQPASVIWANARAYASTSPLEVGALIGGGFVSEGWSAIYPLPAKESRKWWVTFPLSREVRGFLEMVRRRGDLSLNLKIEALLCERKDGTVSFQWVEVNDHDDNSKMYIRVRIPKSDWEKVWGEPTLSLLKKLKKGLVLGKFAQGIKAWWRGKYIQSSLQEILGEEAPKERFHRPWLARVTLAIWNFWCRNWQFIVTTIITVVGLYVLYLTYLKP